MVNPIITTTLPTVIGMGVVSRTTETMFGRKRKPTKAKVRKGRKATMLKGHKKNCWCVVCKNARKSTRKTSTKTTRKTTRKRRDASTGGVAVLL